MTSHLFWSGGPDGELPDLRAWRRAVPYHPRKRSEKPEDKSGEVTVTSAHPDALREAQRLCKGDRKLRAMPDGSVMIENGRYR